MNHPPPPIADQKRAQTQSGGNYFIGSHSKIHVNAWLSSPTPRNWFTPLLRPHQNPGASGAPLLDAIPPPPPPPVGWQVKIYDLWIVGVHTQGKKWDLKIDFWTSIFGPRSNFRFFFFFLLFFSSLLCVNAPNNAVLIEESEQLRDVYSWANRSSESVTRSTSLTGVTALKISISLMLSLHETMHGHSTAIINYSHPQISGLLFTLTQSFILKVSNWTGSRSNTVCHMYHNAFTTRTEYGFFFFFSTPCCHEIENVRNNHIILFMEFKDEYI